MFAVTSYWEKMDAELEIKQGHNLADAAKVRCSGLDRRQRLRRSSVLTLQRQWG